MFNQKGVIPIIIVAVVVLLGASVAGITILNKNNSINQVKTIKSTDLPQASTEPVQDIADNPSISANTLTVKATPTLPPTPTPSPTPRPITLRGYAYEDRNNNSKFDADDIKLPIRDLRWYDTSNPSQKLGFQTDSSGNFSITYSVLGNLGIEGYVWNELTPITGTQVFSKDTADIVIGFRSTKAAEQVGAGIIEGDIFQDSNRNGSRDGGENGIYFYKLYLVDSSGGIRNTVEGAQATDQGGHFKYTNLPFGTYTIKLSNPTGYFVMDKPETTITLSSTNSSVTNIQIPVFNQ